MLGVLVRNWWVLVLQGAIAIIFGILALVWPGLTLVTLVMLFGAYTLVNGVFTLVSGFVSMGAHGRRDRWWAVLIQGAVGVLAGLFILFRPGTSTLILIYLIAAWQLVTGVIEILAAIELRRIVTGEWLLILSGIASILFGVLLIAIPEAGLLGLAWLIGVCAIALGLLFVVVGFRLRGIAGRDQPAPTGTRRMGPQAA